MQAVHDHVTVCAVHPAHNAQQHGAKDKQRRHRKSSSPVLQYVVENTGLRAVTFRVDFSGSRNIILTDSRDISGIPGDSYSDGLAFECTVYPFERRVLVSVAKRSVRERAMIRVTYELLAESEPDVAEITRTLERNAEDVRVLAVTSHASYSFSHPHVRLNTSSSCSSASWNQHIAADFCADVNHYFSLHGDVWVDSTFPVPINPDDMKPRAPTTDNEHHRLYSWQCIPFSMCAWRHLHSLCDDERLWCIFRDTTALTPAKMIRAMSEHEPTDHLSAVDEGLVRARNITRVVSGLPGQQTFSCALAIIAADIGRWKYSWLPLCGVSLIGSDSLDYLKKSVVALPVRLCRGGVQWTAVVIDLLMPTFPLGKGLVAPRSADGELWPALLHKAYAKLKGGYGAVASVSTITILRELLGVPCVCLYDPLIASDRKSKERELQRHLERIFSRARQTQLSNQPMLVATFATVTAPTIAAGAGFSILSYAHATSTKSDFIVLGDVDGMLNRAFGDKKLSFDSETTMESQDVALVAMSWQDFVNLQPSMWTLLPSVKHVRRVRNRFLWQQQDRDGTGDPRAVVVAISVATLSTVILAGNLKVPAAAGADQCRRHERVPARLQVRVCPADEFDELRTLACSDGVSDMELDSCQDRISAQVVRTLAPGEYIVAIRVADGDTTIKNSDNVDAECSCIPLDGQESENGAVLSPSTAEANLAQLFECIDREMRGFLTASDLSALLSQHGHSTTISPTRIEAIEEQFIARFGSPVSYHDLEDDEEEDPDENTRAQVKRGLQLGDLRDVYQFLALEQVGPASGRQSGDQKYRELVWHDLIALLGDASQMEKPCKQKIPVDDIAELICCVSSDSRLVDCVQLPVSSMTDFWAE